MIDIYNNIKHNCKNINYLTVLYYQFKKNFDENNIINLKCEILLTSVICALSKHPCSYKIKNTIQSKFKLLHKILPQNELTEFYNDLSKCLYPKTISTYGFPNSIKFYLENPESLKRVHKLISLLDQLNYEYFISYGTLLGYIRNESLIDYDNDMDIVVKINPKSHSDVQNQLSILKNNLEERGLNCWWGQDRSITIVKVGNGYGDKILRIDLFPWWNIDGTNYIWPGIMGGLSNSDIYPLKKINFLNTNMYIINNPTKLLEINYGANWHIPDMSWTFNWNKPMSIYQSIVKNEH